MPSGLEIHHVIFRRGAKRRFRAGELRRRDNNPPAPGQIPLSLSQPTGSIDEPGRTVWKFSDQPLNLHFDGGAIITTARLVPLFWGEFWRNATNPSVSDIHQAITQILLSPYLSEVMQYGFQSLTLDPARIVVSPGPPFPTFSGDDPKNMVWDLIDDGHFPEPDDDGGRIVYMVFAPHGSDYDVGSALGAHGEASDVDIFDIDYAWVGWCDYFDSLDNITEVFTHELVEILSDPEPYGGWTVPDEEHAEIADVCNNQTGMVSGYRVSAYYSRRLKACVVPTFPHQFGLSVSTKEEGFGPGSESEGFTETTKHSDRSCFNGAYDWTLFGQSRRVTMTAAAVGYVEPEFGWKVNGIPVFNLTALGPPTLPITSPADTALDPLSIITTLPPRKVTAKVAASGNVLILESQLGAPPGDFDVVCTVTEKRLPNGYHTARSDGRAITIAGSVRVMDERFQTDLDKCIHLAMELARALIEEVVIPRIDKGDPPPVWVERALGKLETEIEQQAHEARFLAHFVEAVEPELAAILRQLASGVVALAHATDNSVIEEA